MARMRERVFALTLAGLFLVTSLGFSIIVIWQLNTGSSSNNSTTNNQTTNNTATPPSSKLDGTKLANFTPVTTVPSLQEIDLTPGTGAVVKPGATVTVNFIGAIASTGLVFDSNEDGGQPFTTALSNVIPGWTQGVPGMKVGGTRELLIPSALAYGSQGSGSTIPPNSNLVFDVTVTKTQ